MPKAESEPNRKYREKLDKAKGVVKKYQTPIIIGVTIGVTFVVTRRVSYPMYVRGIGTAVRAKTVNNLYIIIAAKPRSLSYVVRCVETGNLYRSQKHAAKVMKISQTMLSTHLNGKAENVAGYHFVRLGIGA